jgi:hypothetical protein
MKGTLFSADFVKDFAGNLRLLELNTDTGINGDELNNFNFDDFINVLNSNNILEVDIIYKPYIHGEIVNYISQSISINSTSVNNIILHAEDSNTIYPTTITDSESKFILRMAYDESALFDSTYCKSTLDLLNLFTSYDSGSHVASYYYSSSNDFNNTLEYRINPYNIPDVVVKDIIETFNPIDFYKIGSEVDGESEEDRWNSFINLTKSENKIIQQYQYGSDSLDENGHITSVRSYHIVYGSNLDIINLHSFKGSSIFELPTDISSEVNNEQYINKLSDHHYYEYTTNFIKDGSAGILSTHKIQLTDDSYQSIADINVGDSIKSFFISGSPQVETDSEILEWKFEGPAFPEGSFVTSSDVVFKEEKDLKYGGLIEIVVNGESKFSGVSKQWLVYDSSSNESYYKPSKYLDATKHYFFDLDGNLIDIDEANFYVTSDTGLKLIEIDVEDTDTYIVSGSTSFQSIVSHNAPCFVGGTKITLLGGEFKNVEDVNIGDVVLSYNFNTNSVEPQKVQGIGSKKVNSIVKYIFEDGSILESTIDHPLYSKENGWISKSPEYTKKSYGLVTLESQIGFEILKQDGSLLKIKSIEIVNEETIVYNVTIVETNHNFFANEFLVHNRSCFVAGTEIVLENGDVKNIEDIVVGDSVITFNETTGIKEVKLVNKVNTPIHGDLVKYTFSNGIEIISTVDHPFYVNDFSLVSLSPELTNDRYNLSVEVDMIKEGDVVHLIEGDEIVNIKSIELLNGGNTQTYIISVDDNHNFYANGILVHNKL